MNINIEPNDLSILLYTAHENGALWKGFNSVPCTICRDILEQAKDVVLVRDHFHGSDLGACARKIFMTMTNGKSDSGFNNMTFLLDGHLHESSMLKNIEAGLPDDWRVKILENNTEQITELMGFKLVTHFDAFLIDKKNGVEYILECKAVKPKYFKEIADKEQIRDEWYGQGQAYMLVSNINQMIYLIKNREDSKIMFPIVVNKNMEYIASRLMKLGEIYHRIKNGMNWPDREEESKKAFQCTFCQWKDECWA